VLLLDIRRITDFADFFVIATASNRAYARPRRDALQGDPPRTGGKRHEGDRDSLNARRLRDVIVHLFSRRCAPPRA
jgi:ribosomal silencing factor RsfS